MDEPDFDLSDAIGQAVGGAIRAAAAGVFKLLFPPLALASLLEEENGAGLPGFKPVVFEPEKAEIGDAGKTVADQLAYLMSERPKLVLRVCGRATAADFEPYLARAAPTAPELPKRESVAGAGDSPVPKMGEAERRALIENALPEFMALANGRTRALRRYLAEEKAIDSGQVGECRAIFDPGDPGPPRAEITL